MTIAVIRNVFDFEFVNEMYWGVNRDWRREDRHQFKIDAQNQIIGFKCVKLDKNKKDTAKVRNISYLLGEPGKYYEGKEMRFPPFLQQYPGAGELKNIYNAGSWPKLT